MTPETMNNTKLLTSSSASTHARSAASTSSSPTSPAPPPSNLALSPASSTRTRSSGLPSPSAPCSPWNRGFRGGCCGCCRLGGLEDPSAPAAAPAAAGAGDCGERGVVDDRRSPRWVAKSAAVVSSGGTWKAPMRWSTEATPSSEAPLPLPARLRRMLSASPCGWDVGIGMHDV